MAKHRLTKGDVVCKECGQDYLYDQGRRCWKCDGPACAHCLPGPEPVCAECRAEMPRHIEPMLAILSGLPSDAERWAFEIKWDGVRVISYCEGDAIRMESRNLLGITHRYPEFHNLAKSLKNRPCILDGEIIALNAQGRPDFSLLQRRMHLTDLAAIQAVRRRIPAYYMIFDVLFSNGASTLDLPYSERRHILDELKISHPHCRISPSYPAEGRAALEAVREWKFEGIMAKRLDSLYRPGARSPDWLKIKIIQKQELVIGAWTPERNAPNRVGSLHVGYHDRAVGLKYAGRVGTGFNAEEHRMLVERLNRLEATVNPFREPVPQRGVHFVKPSLVAEIEYRRWPEGALMQQAAYKGLRMDKPASDVVREAVLRRTSHVKGPKVRHAR